MPSVAQKEATKRWRENNKEKYDEKKNVYMRVYMNKRYDTDIEKKRKSNNYYYKKEAAIFRLILIDV